MPVVVVAAAAAVLNVCSLFCIAETVLVCIWRFWTNDCWCVVVVGKFFAYVPSGKMTCACM